MTPEQDDLFLGLDIGGSKCSAVVGRRDGQILNRIQWPSLSHRGPSAMIEDSVRPCAQADP